MRIPRLKKSYVSLGIFIVLFFSTYLLSFLGFDKIAKISLYLMLPVFIYGYYHTTILVVKGNRKAYKKLRNKEPIFTDDLLEDKDGNSKSEK